MKLLLCCAFLFLFGGVQCFRIKRQAPDADDTPAPAPDTAGMNVALTYMVDELEKEQSLGGPVNPGGLKKACLIASDIKTSGGEVDKPTQDKLDVLAADYVLQASGPAAFSAFAAPPASSKVNFAQFV